MANHFKSLGFAINKQEDLSDLVKHLEGQSLAKIPFPDGYYYLWRDGIVGTEVWLGMKEVREMVTMNPHFRGRGRFHYEIKGIDKDEYAPYEAHVEGWVDPYGNHEASEGYPLRLYIPNYAILDLSLGARIEMQISGFAWELTCHSSEGAFSSHHAPMKMDRDYFIDVGHMNADGSAPEKPRPMALLGGKILEAQLMTNPFSKNSFYHLLIEHRGMTIDVVADPEIVKGDPLTSSIAEGMLWCSAYPSDFTP